MVDSREGVGEDEEQRDRRDSGRIRQRGAAAAQGVQGDGRGHRPQDGGKAEVHTIRPRIHILRPGGKGEG